MSKLTESARGRECQIRIPGICNRDESTTVLCHLGGAGMGLKHDDRHAAFGCSACHDEVDRRTRKIPYEMAKLYLLEAIIRTQAIWIKEGLM